MSEPIIDEPLRCLDSGNPCGTDCRVIGKPCQCPPCRAAARIRELEAEIERLREGMNTRYWEGIREDNTNLRGRIRELEAALADVSRQYHAVMGLLKKTKLAHGTCFPRSRMACTACLAQQALDTMLAKYRGGPVAAQENQP